MLLTKSVFFTMIFPHYTSLNNKFDVLDISCDEWEEYAKNDILYTESVLGKVRSKRNKALI